ncbi:hypothetical protein D3C76_1556930 [compost metagenome]
MAEAGDRVADHIGRHDVRRPGRPPLGHNQHDIGRFHGTGYRQHDYDANNGHDQRDRDFDRPLDAVRPVDRRSFVKFARNRQNRR